MNAAVNPEKIIPIRASSLSDLFDCPARWEAKNLLNKRTPAGARTRLGTASNPVGLSEPDRRRRHPGRMRGDSASPDLAAE
ncbi:hypothetical protein [Acinetobacter radioresistens]|uniref:hypothetical protein n=1 Tax=Acinetobacter radioresistens TaxID=40216 RepID=UPI0020917D65|nr:hypothetical protein [Acinetobacter radioresistens]